MKLWQKKFLVFVIAGVMYFVGQHMRWGGTSFSELGNVDFPVIVGGEITAIVGLVLLFANGAGFRKWLWASLVYIPVSIIIISDSAPVPGELFSFGPSPEQTTWFLGYGYILLTLLIVLYAWWKGRRATHVAAGGPGA